MHTKHTQYNNINTHFILLNAEHIDMPYTNTHTAAKHDTMYYQSYYNYYGYTLAYVERCGEDQHHT